MDIRNICLLGHGGSGKTSLVESMLYITGATDRLGKPADGNTVCDYDPEEIKRQISISLAMTPVMYNGVKINVLDAPGNFDFAGEMQSGVRAAEVGVLVCASKDGLSVGAERGWKYLKEQKKPCIVYVSKEDEENANFSETLAALREKLGNSIAPVVAPIWDDNKRTIGIIDVLNRKAYQMPADRKGKRVEIPIPESKQKVLDELYNQLMEAVAETTEENMEKFFAGEAFTKDEIMTGLKVGMHEGTLAPVVCGSAVTGLGTEMLLSTIVDLVPGPQEMPAETGTDESGENSVEVKRDPNGPTAAIVFKTISDQYGKYSLVKVVSGKITGDMNLYNPSTGKTEKLGRLYTIKGKKNEEVKEIACGDIGAIAKMDRLKTGDTRRTWCASPLCSSPSPATPVPSPPRPGARTRRWAPASSASTRRTPPSPWSTTPRPIRWWSPARATSRSMCWSASSRAASAWRPSWIPPVWPTARRSASRCASRAATRSRPAAAASSVMSILSSSPRTRART